jgi:hypothetical protein
VFSLTNNDKLEVVNAEMAIQNEKTMGPIFGQSDFDICDKANKDDSSWAFINCSYKNEKYEMTSGIRFGGSP